MNVPPCSAAATRSPAPGEKAKLQIGARSPSSECCIERTRTRTRSSKRIVLLVCALTYACHLHLQGGSFRRWCQSRSPTIRAPSHRRRQLRSVAAAAAAYLGCHTRSSRTIRPRSAPPPHHATLSQPHYASVPSSSIDTRALHTATNLHRAASQSTSQSTQPNSRARRERERAKSAGNSSSRL